MNGLEAARAKVAEMRARGEQPQRLNPIESARRNPASRAAAIRAMCWTCQGCDADPGVQWRVGNCQITECPLWPHRPWKAQRGKPMPVALETSS